MNELAEPFPVSVQAISKHLKVLERAGLIRAGARRSCVRPASRARPCATRRTGSSSTARSGRAVSIASRFTSETSNERRTAMTEQS